MFAPAPGTSGVKQFLRHLPFVSQHSPGAQSVIDIHLLRILLSILAMLSKTLTTTTEVKSVILNVNIFFSWCRPRKFHEPTTGYFHFYCRVMLDDILFLIFKSKDVCMFQYLCVIYTVVMGVFRTAILKLHLMPII